MPLPLVYIKHLLTVFITVLKHLKASITGLAGVVFHRSHNMFSKYYQIKYK